MFYLRQIVLKNAPYHIIHVSFIIHGSLTLQTVSVYDQNHKVNRKRKTSPVSFHVISKDNKTNSNFYGMRFLRNTFYL